MEKRLTVCFLILLVVCSCLKTFAQQSDPFDLTGVVVISDLDHTVIEYQNTKTTIASKLGSLLTGWKKKPVAQNVVDGVPEVLLQLQSQGARIIFVTGRDALDRESTKKELIQLGFAAPEVHMRGYAGQSLREFKYFTIAEIIKSMPDKKIVLLGDTAHSDPDAFSYLQMLAEIKNQIIGVFVRPVSNHRPNPGQRFFRNGADLIKNLMKIGLSISPSSALMRSHSKYCLNLF